MALFPNPIANLDGDTIYTSTGSTVLVDDGSNATLPSKPVKTLGVVDLLGNTDPFGFGGGSGITLSDGFNDDSKISVNGREIGEISSTSDYGSKASILFVFNGSATSADVQHILRSLTYTNSLGGDGGVSVSLFHDDDGQDASSAMIYIRTGSPPPVVGTKGRDHLTGTSGNDKLNGGLGNDVLTGGLGQDVFVFDSKLGKGTTKANQNKKVNYDTITDFTKGEDKIWLDNKIFTKLGKGSEAAPATLSKKFFSLNKAKDKNDYLIYKKGVVYYDKDGSGSKYKPVEIIKLSNKAKLTFDDFQII